MADAGGFDYWRGDEQAPLPALGSNAGGFDYWRGGELLPVYSDAATSLSTLFESGLLRGALRGVLRGV